MNYMHKLIQINNILVVIIINNNFHTEKGYELINVNKNYLTASMEDYLEMLYRCSLENTYLRINVIAKRLNVKDSSVSKMMKKIKDLSLISYEKYGIITLTDKGKKIGFYLYQRHIIVESFLKFLTNKKDVLLETELIEHTISPETVKDLNDFNNFINKYPTISSNYLTFKESINNKK